MKNDILYLGPKILNKRYCYKIIYYGKNENILKLNNKTIEVDEDFIKYYIKDFLRIMFEFKNLQFKDKTIIGFIMILYLL